jgi:intracellular multiplication protein IcmL
MIVLLIDVVLLFSVIDHYINPPEPQYFATNAAYQLIKWHPLSDPVVDDNYVKQWVSNAVQQSFSLDYIHWRSQLQNASDNFTPSGWQLFLQSFQKSGDLESLVKLKMVSNATVTGAPVILYQAVLDGRYVWKVELPIMITYMGEKVIRQPLKVIVIVVRVPVQDDPDQIAINEFAPAPQE